MFEIRATSLDVPLTLCMLSMKIKGLVERTAWKDVETTAWIKGFVETTAWTDVATTAWIKGFVEARCMLYQSFGTIRSLCIVCSPQHQ